jgi:hypothetical protein
LASFLVSNTRKLAKDHKGYDSAARTLEDIFSLNLATKKKKKSKKKAASHPFPPKSLTGRSLIFIQNFEYNLFRN